jgi:hypothetical protein
MVFSLGYVSERREAKMRERSPPHHEVMKFLMSKLCQGFGKNVSPIHGGGYLFCGDGSFVDVVSKMMVFTRDVFGSWTVLGVPMSNNDTRCVILKDSGGRKLHCGVICVREGVVRESSFKIQWRGMSSLAAMLRAIYSASVVLSTISDWSLLPHWTGHPLYVMT